MENFEEKINSVLGNPEMMQKIMTIAQSLNSGEQSQDAPSPQLPPGLDFEMLQKISSLSQQGSITKDQQNLLQALRPYLQTERIHKLENAMRAAKMARIVAGAFNSAPHQAYR